MRKRKEIKSQLICLNVSMFKVLIARSRLIKLMTLFFLSFFTHSSAAMKKSSKSSNDEFQLPPIRGRSFSEVSRQIIPPSHHNSGESKFRRIVH